MAISTNLKQIVQKLQHDVKNATSTILDASQQQHQQEKSQVKIVVVGLENSGKSSIVSKIKSMSKKSVMFNIMLNKKEKNELPTVINPTHGFHMDMFKIQKTTFTTFEIGGNFLKTKHLAKHYFEKNDAVVFVVDSSDRNKIDVARETLHAIMMDPLVSNCKLLILANKQDLEESPILKKEELITQLHLNDIKQKWTIHSTSAKNGSGLFESFDWISKVD